jgi:hypothetical protein
MRMRRFAKMRIGKKAKIISLNEGVGREGEFDEDMWREAASERGGHIDVGHSDFSQRPQHLDFSPASLIYLQLFNLSTFQLFNSSNV